MTRKLQEAQKAPTAMVRRLRSRKLLASSDVWRWLKLPKSRRLYSRNSPTASAPIRMPPSPPFPSCQTIPRASDLVVIDTNAVLDWLVFEDPSTVALSTAILGGSLQWVATSAMHDELALVLARPTFERWAHRREAAIATVERHCLTVAEPSVSVATRLHCSDADDQKFIDLALFHPTRWLLSRDKALLRLDRKSRPRGLRILTPSSWAKQVSVASHQSAE